MPSESSFVAEANFGCGVWRPGDGEPGEDWTYTPAALEVSYDPSDRAFNVAEVTPDGLRALCCVPLEVLFAALACPEGGAEALARFVREVE